MDNKLLNNETLESSLIQFLYDVINKKYNSNSKGADFMFGGFNLPNTMDYLTWGSVISKKDNVVLVAKANTSSYYKITVFNGYNEVQVLSNNIVIISFKDILNDV